MIFFVTFHISPENPIEISPDSLNYQTIINLMFHSTSLLHGDCHKVVLSDLHTDFSQLSPDISVQRYDIDSHHIMLNRLSTQIQFLKTMNQESNVVLLDSDMLITANLNPLLLQDFDIGLTIRTPAPVYKGKPMPINGGIFFIPASGKSAALRFLEQLYHIYQKHYGKDTQWWGDQYALLDILQCPDANDLQPGCLQLNDIKVRLLDCDQYNFSPDLESELDLTAFQDKFILHFKGPRKQFMQAYWEQFINPDRPTLPLETAHKALELKISLLQENRFEMKRQIQELKQVNKALMVEKKHLAAVNAQLTARSTSRRPYIRYLIQKLKKYLSLLLPQPEAEEEST